MLDDIVGKYNKAFLRTIKMKPKIDVKCGSYAECGVDSDTKNAKFKVGDLIKISKYKNIFVEGYTKAYWSKVVFVISKIKNTVPWTYLISDPKGEEIHGTFYEKEFQKTNQTEMRVEKVIKIIIGK